MEKSDADKNRILQETTLFVREMLNKESSGHDWWHIYRVKNLALQIAKKEGGDKFIIALASLLHDVDDWKVAGFNQESKKAEEWMTSLSLSKDTIDRIHAIIEEVSFKGNGVEDITTSLEAKIVQDADRLDAIGAIGIARAFAFGGSRGRLLYDPEEKPEKFDSFEAYKNNKGTTINHFYEKLLLLKDRMNTTTGKALAVKRHLFMKTYLTQFFSEWEVEL